MRAVRSLRLAVLLVVWMAPPPAFAGLDARTARLVAEVMALSEKQTLACVPKLNPLVGCANPETLEYPRQYREWDWSPLDPERVIDPKTGMKFPNAKYPLDRSFTVLNTIGESITIPYYQGKKPISLADYDGPGFRHRRRHVDRYFFSYAAANEQYDWMLKAIELLQTAYKETGDDVYARRLGLILYDFGRKLKHYPIVDGNGAQGGKYPISTGGPFMLDGKQVGKAGVDRPYPGNLTAYLTRKGFFGEVGPAKIVAEALVMIRDSPAMVQLSREKGVDIVKAIEHEPVRFLVDHVISYPWKGAHLRNNLQGYVRQIGDIGKMISEPEYIHFVYNFARKAPFYYDVTHDGLTGGGTAYGTGASFLEKGLFLSGYSDPPGYVSQMDGLHLENVDIVRDLPFLDLLGRAKERLRMPNGDLAPFHDRNHKEEHPGWRSGGGTKLLPTPLQESRNYVAAGWGHAVLGDGHVGPEHWKTQSQAHLHFSLAAEHAHNDCNSILLFAHGEEMISDLGYFHHPLRWWSGGSFSHNLVVIDEQEQNREQSKGMLDLCVTDWPGLAVVRSEGRNAYRGIARRYRRTLIQNTRNLATPYVIDVFEVEGGDQHDWLLHGAASPSKKQTGSSSLALEPMPGERPLSSGSPGDRKWKRDAFGYTKLDPFGMWSNVHAGVADQPFTVDFRYRHDRDLGSRTHFPAHPNTKVYLGETVSMRLPLGRASRWKENYEQKMPHLILRRAARGTKSVFVAVHELFQHGPAIRRVRQIPAEDDQVLLEIEFSDHTDRLLYSLAGSQQMRLKDLSTDGELAFLSRVNGKTDAYLYGGMVVKEKTDTLLATEAKGWTGILHDTRRRFAGNQATAFLTDAQLPGGRQLHGDWLHLTFTGKWRITDLGQRNETGLTGDESITTAYQIDFVERRDDMTWVHLLDADPGLIRTVDGHFEELFLGRRIFDGPGTFKITSSSSTVPDYVRISPGLKPADDFSEISFVPFAGAQEVTLQSSPGATIHYTLDGSQPTTRSPLYREPLSIAHDTTVRAASFASAMGGQPRTRTVHYRAPLPAVAVGKLAPGLRVKTYRPIKTTVDLPREDYARHCLNIGSPDDLPASSDGVSSTTSLVDDFYVLKRRMGYYGYLKVPSDAVYTFHILANPGLVLAIDGEILHNKRRIGMQRIWQESIALQKGHHQIQILYSDNRIKEGGPLIDLKLSYNSSAPRQIPADWLFHE